MYGGLIQIVSSGKEDVYLTIEPEITFFKKVYKKHTNFSIELREFLPNQLAEYNNIISFNINSGDAIHRCYLEIDLPLLNFSDNYINNQLYIKNKNINISNTNLKINELNTEYNNLKEFINIEILLYRSLSILLLAENININTLQNEVIVFNYNNKTIKDLYINKIENYILDNINISNYISSIDKLITNLNSYNNNIYISRNEIINNIDKLYNNMLTYLKDYNNHKNYYNNKLNNLQNPNQIQFNYSPFLGHNYFEHFSLEIGGIEYQKYSNNVLHINQSHNIKNDYINNYYKMIGNIDSLNTFDNKTKGNTKILVPLQFWFNRFPGQCLPLVALQYADVVINTKINNLNNIISFENYEQMYYDITNYTSVFIDQFIINTKLIYKKYKFDAINKSINYNCLYINNELLKLSFPDLLDTEINLLLSENGTLYTQNQITKLINPELSDTQINIINKNNGNATQYLINKFQWMGLMINIKKYISFSYKFASYFPFIDFNLYYSLINLPQIKLICETIYFDDTERAKFANSKLEYVVEIFDENIFNIHNQQSFDCELSFNSLSKEMLWYIQPQIYIDKFTESGQNTNLLYDNFKYFTNNPIKTHNLLFNQIDALLPNVDLNYYTNLLSYKYLNNTLPDGIYYQSFSLYPEEGQPSGTINLRQIKGKQYTVFFNEDFMNEYNNVLYQLYNTYSSSLLANKKKMFLTFITKNYNLLIIHKGMSQLLF